MRSKTFVIVAFVLHSNKLFLYTPAIGASGLWQHPWDSDGSARCGSGRRQGHRHQSAQGHERHYAPRTRTATTPSRTSFRILTRSGSSHQVSRSVN